MKYPRECFNINEDITRKNMKSHDDKTKIWHEAAQKLYPDFYKMKLNSSERAAAEDAVNKYVGFKRP